MTRGKGKQSVATWRAGGDLDDQLREIVRAALLEAGCAGLVAENAHLRGALETCAKTFRRYAQLHRAKATTEGNLKASNNDDLADFCEGVLADCTALRGDREQGEG